MRLIANQVAEAKRGYFFRQNVDKISTEKEDEKMDNQITVFASDKFGDVRIIQIDSEPWFVGKDVAEILGYRNPNEAIQDHVDSEDKFIRSQRGREMLKLFSSLKDMQEKLGRQDNWFINESGVYSLIFGSKLPQAKEFKHWVTHEVLPSIRKHGAYLTDNALEEALTSPDFLIKLATQLKEEKEARLEAEKKIEEQKPKVIFADAVSASKSSILIGDLAKLIRQNGVEVGQKRLFEWLRQNGWLMKSGNSKNMPTQRGMEMKLFEVKEGSYVDSNGVNVVTKTTKVTGKGQQYFVNVFLNGRM